jgi:Pyruvate/2-oxoacid:ferredoxin oxidoreductase delta subunit
MSDDETVTRRGFFGMLRGRKAEAEPVSPEVEPDTDEDLPPPWAARQRAQRAVATVPQLARVLGFECIAGTAGLCATCIERCPIPGALVTSGGPPRVDATLCDGCGACEEACPAPRKAIIMLPRIDGRAKGM